MTDILDAERLCYLTRAQTDLVIEEVRLAMEAIGPGTEDEEYEEQDDANAFHTSRGRPTAIIIPFSASGVGRKPEVTGSQPNRRD
jgi:hypothetical protein